MESSLFCCYLPTGALEVVIAKGEDKSVVLSTQAQFSTIKSIMLHLAQKVFNKKKYL